MARRRPLIAGNWKMYGTSKTVSELLEGLRRGCNRITTAELAVFPPYVFIPQCKNVLMKTQISWGAQDISQYEDGAYTGEVSGKMLRDFFCRYVIVGHSERRKLCNEKNETVAKKVRKSLESGISPILCVGETEEQYKKKNTTEAIHKQLAVVLRMHNNQISLNGIVIAYEPVWAIGTGKILPPIQVEKIHAAIRKQLMQYDIMLARSTRILYGGSVKPENAKDLFKVSNVDGALVGSASLLAEQFLRIGEQCN
ncbi:triosephosphate isomerase [Coxiella endosymbiont of Amblyomma americanum]|nr:triosephosphate isomerase [Coxiella endosymbiont of Amblyomma americanum]